MTLPSITGLERIPDDALASLREKLRAATYDGRIIARAETIGGGSFDALRIALVHFALQKLATPAADLAALFAYGATVRHADVVRALGDSLAATLIDGGIFVRQGENVRSPFQLLPVDDIWILSDEPSAGDEAVMPPGPTTLHLISAVPPRVTGATLDVGCGPGTLALLLANRGASRSVGTDISARAITVARFNARLNALAVDLRVGDLLAPVAGERFDFIASQPAYVLQPPDTPSVTFMHGGAMGDELTMRLFAGLGDVMATGARAAIVFDSAVRPKEPVATRVRRALGNAPVDALLLVAPGLTPDMQSIGYASMEAPDFGPKYREASLRYRRHLDSIGIHETNHVLATLRARTDRVFTATLPVRGVNLTHGAAQIDALFAALEAASRDDARLLASRVRVAAAARFVEERPRPEPTAEPSRTIRFPPGHVATDREISEAASVLYDLIEQADTVRDALAGYAAACETTADDVQEQMLAFVREGLARAVLVVS